MKRTIVLLVVACLAVFGVACGDDAEQDAREAAGEVGEEVRQGAQEAAEEAREAADRAEDVIDDRNVEIKDFAYEPGTLNIKLGTEVTWINRDDVPHTATADNNSFDTENIASGEEGSYRFTQEGEYTYFCSVHGKERMSAKIVVS